MAAPSKRPSAPDGTTGKPSIAVLPFANLSGDPAQEYFSDGVVEDVITALSRTGWLFVIARNSSFTYKGRVVDMKQVGRELDVRYVLEGSIRRAGCGYQEPHPTWRKGMNSVRTGHAIRTY
jgi:TolB-like protein